MVPRLIRKPAHEVRTRVLDGARWRGYRPRADDIIISTYPKCGTTWMQRIVCMLVFHDVEPRPLSTLSIWPDMRILGPIDALMARAEEQAHRRFFKSHLPIDALPVYEGVKFIHVARDGRDAALSYHNHRISFTADARARFDAISLADPKFGTPYPDTPKDPAVFFHEWLTSDSGDLGGPRASFFYFENAFWAARKDENVLLVHYNDLKASLAAEMLRVAQFLEIDVPEALWPELVASAEFEAMKADGAKLAPRMLEMFEGGPDRFFHRGTNGRWRDVYATSDLELYEAKVEAALSPSLARWLEHGRLVAGDPREAAD
jgi:aryl sulfotransferase